MKKYMVLLIAFVTLFAFGCSNTGNGINTTHEGDSSSNKVDLNANEIDLDAILEVDNKQLNTELEFNHKEMISGDVQHSIDETAQVDKSLVINNEEHSLRYKDTLYYPIGGQRAHEYFVDGDENSIILLDDTGAINSILYEYAVLSISQVASPNEVCELLKQEISKIIDISYYENVTIPEPKFNSTGFGIYDYLFYNQKNNYMTDYLKVSVSDNGGVFGLSIRNLSEKNFSVNVNKEKEKNAIELKLKDIYNTDVTQYQSHHIRFNPCIVTYENQLYVEYIIATNYTHTQYGEMSSFLQIILIPLNLICD